MPHPPHQKNIVHGSITASGDVRIGDDYITYHNYFAAQEVKIPHRLTNNIPTNADHILGRATELAQAKDHLAQHQATILFNGIGGIGKTALASKYMALHGSEYKHLAWITAQSTLAEAFTNNAPLLASLQITQQVQHYIEAKQLDKAFEYLFHQLNLLERTLVVIDNANDLEDLEQYKNWFDTANCHFLITSRSQPSEWATVEVDSLPEDEAVALFRKLHPSVSADDEAIKNLLSKLFYHTLLIELVAKAGASTGIAFADLQTMIETQFIHHQSLNEAPVPTGKHGSVVATNLKKAKIENYIWLIFSQLKDLNDEYKDVLRAIVLLPPAKPFAISTIKAFFSKLKLRNFVPNLIALVDLGWIEKLQYQDYEPFYKVHPLIADVIIKHLDISPKSADSYISLVANMIYYRSEDPRYTLYNISISKYLAERLSNIFFNKTSESLSELFDNLSILYKNFGLYDNALKFSERAVEIASEIFDENSKIIAQRNTNLSAIYHFLGKNHQASNLLKYTLNVTLKNFDSSSYEVLNCQTVLGLVYMELGNFKESLELLQTVLQVVKKKYKNNHARIARYQSNLALVYSELGSYSEAAFLLEMALKSQIKIFGEHHFEITTTQSNLAAIYLKFGNYEKAEVLLKNSIDIIEKNIGKDNPILAQFQSNLGVVYRHLGKYKKSKNILNTALVINIRHLGVDHPNISNHLSNLASTYHSFGKYKKALRLFKKALKNLIQNFDKDHPRIPSEESNIGVCYERLGNYEKAAKFFERALINEIKIYGENHPGVATIQSNLGDTYRQLKQYRKAINLLEKALASNIRNFGNEHPSVTKCQVLLANAYSDIEDYKKAVNLLEDALSKAEKSLGVDHPDIAKYQANLANTYICLGENFKAVKLLELALNSHEKIFGKDHPEVGICQWSLAAAYYSISEITQAKILLNKAYQCLLKSLGAEHPHTIKLKQWIISVYS